MLRNRTVKTTKYSHWLSDQMPPRMQESDKEHLLRGLRQGNRESRILIIEGHMRLASDIVGRYRTVLPNVNTDELLSCAFEAVVTAVDRAVDLRHDNITAYITSYIHNYVQRYGIDPYSSPHGRLKHEYTIPDSRSHEIAEEIEAVTRDDTDAVIIEMLGRGNTQEEIAKHLQISQPAVAKRIRRLRERLLERQNVVE